MQNKEMQMEPCIVEVRFLKERRLFYIFTLLTITAPFLSLIETLRPNSEEFHTWFQRSGSAMVVLALLAETHAYQMFDAFKPTGFVSNTYSSTKEKYYHQVKWYNLIAFVLLTFGTIIWGYGDLLI